jgi:hypothetical protein
MKAIKFLRAAIVLLSILLSACAPAANSAPGIGGGGKALADVVISGAIESMNGHQWVVNGKTVRVDPSVLRDEPFAVGDTVKVEASMSDDGTVTTQQVETPAAGIPAESASRAPDDSFSMPDNSATPQPPIFDDQGNEAVGIVDAVADTSITVGGQTYTFAQGVEFKGDIVAGASVKLHFTVNADGTFSVTEIELTNATQLDDDNSTDDSSAHEVNDDHGGETNINDDGANHDVNDDHGGNSTSGGGSDGNSGSNSAKGG